MQKKFPWHPDTTGPFNAESSMNAEDIANLKKWGFTAVRLGVMWPGVEPSPGQFNMTYLKVAALLTHTVELSTVICCLPLLLT